MSLQVSHYNMLRASHEVSQKVVVRTVITVRFVPEVDGRICWTFQTKPNSKQLL